MLAPTAQRIAVVWKEPVVARGRVATPEGAPIEGMSVAAFPPAPIDERIFKRMMPRGQLGRWTCSPLSDERILSAPDGTFALPVEPDARRLIVAGSWDDPRGIDFKTWARAGGAPMELVPRPSWLLTARLLDDDDRPVAGHAYLPPDGSDDDWARRVVPGSEREADIGADGKLRIGPSRAPRYDVLIQLTEALPVSKSGDAPSAGGKIDLGDIRVDRGTDVKVDVRDPDDRPVADAYVRGFNGSSVEVWREVRTDSKGVAVLRGLAREPLADLEVRASGFVGQNKRGVAIGDGTIHVRLERGVSIRGHVRSPDDDPISASVWIRDVADKYEGGGFTEEDGSFEFGVAPGKVQVVATAVGFGDSEPLSLDLISGAPPAQVVLQLTDPKSLRGIVVDPDGQPVAGATVSVTNDAFFGSPYQPGPHTSTVSGPDGRFELASAAGLMDVVVAQKPGYSPAKLPTSVVRDVPEIQLRLGPSAALRALLPAAVPSNGFLAVEVGRLYRQVVRVDGRTEIVLEDLPPGGASVGLWHGFERMAELRAGETITVDLRSSGRIHGRVTRAGRGVARAVVADTGTSDDSTIGGRTTITDDDGAFDFESVSSGEHLLVAQATEGRAQQRVIVSDGADASANLEVADVRVRVSAVDRRSGEPIPGANVLVSPQGVTCHAYAETGSRQGSAGWRLQTSDAGCAKNATGADGVAALPLDAVGPYTVQVTSPGFQDWSAPVELVDGTVSVRAELAAGGPATVRVIIDTETPGVQGTLYCIQGDNSDSHAPASVRDVCERLQPGPAEVAFRAPEFGAARAAVTVPEQGEVTVTLHVARGGDLVIPLGSPTMPKIALIDAAGVAWNQPAGLGWPYCGFATPQGSEPRYDCHGLPPGVYTIRFDGQPHGTAVIRPGETTTVY